MYLDDLLQRIEEAVRYKQYDMLKWYRSELIILVGEKQANQIFRKYNL